MTLARSLAGGSIALCILALAAATPLGAQENEWQAPGWLMNAEYAPAFRVRDTVNKYGRYDAALKTVTLADLMKFHGHFCGGLVEAAGALRLAFDQIFPDGVVDRTDLRIASNNSACGGDVAAYLTGARTRFGSHLIDKTLTASEFVVQRVSTGKTARVLVREEAYPTEVRKQMSKIEAGDATTADFELFQQLQWDYARTIVSRPLSETFRLIDSAGYQWPQPPCPGLGRRKDNDYKDISKR